MRKNPVAFFYVSQRFNFISVKESFVKKIDSSGKTQCSKIKEDEIEHFKQMQYVYFWKSKINLRKQLLCWKTAPLLLDSSLLAGIVADNSLISK